MSDGTSPVLKHPARKASAKSARSRAREFALQALYQHLVGRNDAHAIDLFTRDLAGFH
jgi:N utilization substance protein B